MQEEGSPRGILEKEERDVSRSLHSACAAAMRQALHPQSPRAAAARSGGHLGCFLIPHFPPAKLGPDQDALHLLGD